MKRVVLYALDRLLVASVAAVIVLAAQYATHPQGTTAAVAHSAAVYPVTVEASPTMTFDDSAALASFLVRTRDREWAFEAAFEQDLHNHDATFHLTHECIDGHKF
jgi:hypothetical protein